MEHGTVAERVARGVEWLNENHELLASLGWENTGAVDLDTFDIDSGVTCVIAQMSGTTYRSALDAVEDAQGGDPGYAYGADWARHHGFMSDRWGGDSGDDRALLEAEWVRVILADRAKGGV